MPVAAIGRKGGVFKNCALKPPFTIVSLFRQVMPLGGEREPSLATIGGRRRVGEVTAFARLTAIGIRLHLTHAACRQ